MIILYKVFTSSVVPALVRLSTPVGAIIITIIGIGIALSCVGISFSLTEFSNGLFRGFGRTIGAIVRGLIRFMRFLVVTMTPRAHRSIRRFFDNLGMHNSFSNLFATIGVILMWVVIII